METLEYGYLLIRRRPRLEALANWLTADPRRARAAAEKALMLAWRSRDVLNGEVELDLNLRRWCCAALAEPSPPPEGEAESRAP